MNAKNDQDMRARIKKTMSLGEGLAGERGVVLLLETRGEQAGPSQGKYILNMDLSCNRYISDDGICDHLAPFLGTPWERCARWGVSFSRALSSQVSLCVASGGRGHSTHSLRLSWSACGVSPGVPPTPLSDASSKVLPRRVAGDQKFCRKNARHLLAAGRGTGRA